MALTKKQRAELRMKFGGRCAYCGCELGEKWHADHVKPVIRFDGNMLHQERDDISNMVPACHLNRPGFPGECFICELRLPDHRFRWKHNKLFLLLP
ncbi:HNH endonuclease, partial [Escherichia coli]|uniref:HNH endonuclease n=1 Tax=Escherichia coli TaxID=562 RepID=UPI0032E409E6